MKKIICIILILTLKFLGLSQSSLMLNGLDPSGTATISVISNGSSISMGTWAGQNTAMRIRITNLSSVNTNTYNVIRTIKTLHTGASAYFCFNTVCFPAAVSTPTNSQDYMVLAPGTHNSGGVIFTVDLDESVSGIGYSEVVYKVYNIANPGSDTISFTMKYNPQVLGVKNLSDVFFINKLFPNPASNITKVSIESDQYEKGTLYAVNGMGQIIYSEDLTIHPGNTQLDLNCEEWIQGIYSIKVVTSKAMINQKLIVSK